MDDTLLLRFQAIPLGVCVSTLRIPDLPGDKKKEKREMNEARTGVSRISLEAKEERVRNCFTHTGRLCVSRKNGRRCCVWNANCFTAVE